MGLYKQNKVRLANADCWVLLDPTVRPGVEPRICTSNTVQRAVDAARDHTLRPTPLYNSEPYSNIPLRTKLVTLILQKSTVQHH